MMYIPNPKALVYSELHFISITASMRPVSISLDDIFDEVSQEILALFVESPSVAPSSLIVREKAGEALCVSEVLN
jgi:hypothetical protein